MKLKKNGRDKPKKEKKPKLTLEQKAQANKEKVEKQAAAKIKKAEDKVKKAEQTQKNKESAAVKKEKDKEKNAANKIKAAEMKVVNKQKNKIQKEADKIKKRAEKLQRKAELANRSPMEKKLDRRKSLIKMLAVILALAVVGGGIFFGKQYIPKIVPVVKEKIEKIPFFNKEKEEEKEKDKDKDKEETAKEEPEAEEMALEEEIVDDTTLHISGTTVLEAFYSDALKEFLNLTNGELEEHSKAISNHESYVNLVNGDNQVIFAAFPTYQEESMAELAAVDLQAIPILNGGFVFFVNKDNPVNNLTMTQLHSIYAGNITNWKDLGGNDEPIAPFQRTENSGSQIGMYKYIIAESEIMSASEDLKMSETGDVSKVVSESEGGIGYSYYYYMNQLKNSDKVKMISVNGVKPNDKTIAMAQYPLTTYTYAIVATEESTASLEDVLTSVATTIDAINTEGEAADIETDSDEESTSGAAVEAPLPLKMQFVEWILSDEGQALAEKHGFVRHGNK